MDENDLSWARGLSRTLIYMSTVFCLSPPSVMDGSPDPDEMECIS